MLVHICVWRLWLTTFSNSSVQFLQSICLHSVLSCVYAFCTLCLSSFHHDDYACALLCLLLSTYSTASSSSLRNFRTCKFLSEEFIQIAYSPPSSRYNALLVFPFEILLLLDWILFWIWEHLIYVLHMNTRGDNGVSYWFTWYVFWHSIHGFSRWHWGNYA